MALVAAMAVEDGFEGYTQDGTVDLKDNPVLRSQRGGWKACWFVVGKTRSIDDDDDEQQLKIFDSSLHKRIQSIKDSVNSGSSNGAASLSSLILVISCLGETNQDVVDILRRSKDDIYRSPELRALVNDYFRYSHNTLEFLNILEHWLNGGEGVSWKLRRIRSALTEFKAKKTKTRFQRTTSLQILQRALSGFTITKAGDGDGVARLLSRQLAAILDEQNRLHERLLDQRREADFQRQGRLNTYRKISTVILASLYIGLLACAVAAALSTMHPQIVIAVAVAIGSMNPTGQVERLVDYLLKKYEEKLRKRSDLLSSLREAGSRMTVEDLEVVKVAVQSFEERLKGFS